MADYALYKGDKFIDLGTRKYLAQKLNVSTRTISFYGTPTHLKRSKSGNSYIVIKIEKEDKDV